MTDVNKVTWNGERWYGDPKWSSSRGKPGTLLFEMAFTLEGDVYRPGHSTPARLLMRVPEEGKTKANKLFGEVYFPTTKEAKRELNKLWRVAQNSAMSPENAAEWLKVQLGTLNNPNCPPTPPGRSNPGHGYGRHSSWNCDACAPLVTAGKLAWSLASGSESGSIGEIDYTPLVLAWPE